MYILQIGYSLSVQDWAGWIKGEDANISITDQGPWLGVGDMTKILYHDMTNFISR